ncbi:hypothetical protein MYX76_11890 [Desulfobacterota bacterium AH_259_B03_O07]|nr:hypothetical protein [Desulfobacterota bacterium AH_259_B03_O07]
MKTKDKEFKEFVQEHDGLFSSHDIEDTSGIDMVEPMSEIEFEEAQSTDKEENRIIDKQFKLLYAYFREIEIVKMRYGIDYEDAFTVDEVGKMFGVSRERIRQIEKAALEKIANSNMKEILKDHYI